MMPMTTAEKVDLLERELGLDYHKLAQIKREEEITAEQQRKEKVEEEQRQQEIRRLQKAYQRLEDDLLTGKAILFLNGKPTKPLPLYKSGCLDSLVRSYQSVRQALLQNFKGYVAGSKSAAIITRNIQTDDKKCQEFKLIVSSDK